MKIICVLEYPACGNGEQAEVKFYDFDKLPATHPYKTAMANTFNGVYGVSTSTTYDAVVAAGGWTFLRTAEVAPPCKVDDRVTIYLE